MKASEFGQYYKVREVFGSLVFKKIKKRTPMSLAAGTVSICSDVKIDRTAENRALIGSLLLSHFQEHGIEAGPQKIFPVKILNRGRAIRPEGRHEWKWKLVGLPDSEVKPELD